MVEAILAGLLGLLIGSFLNVCVYRMPRDLSVVHPRSFCPSCKTPVASYDNIPVISWLLLGRACRHCRAPIHWRYPLLELITGVLFFAAVMYAGPTALAAKLCAISVVMIALIFMDLEERILADEFTLGGTLAGVVFAWFVPLPASLISMLLPTDWDPRWQSVAESAIAACGLAFLLWGIGKLYYVVRRREGMGFGDVKMVACMGAFLGLPGALLALIIGSLLGSVGGGLMIWLGHKDPSSYQIPFGTFLGLGALCVAFGALSGT